MKKLLRTILPAFLLTTLFCGSALAQTPKIATVDLGNVFTNYYKTKLARAALDERKAQLEKDDKAMIDDFKKASDDYQQALAKVNDPAISSDERARRKSDVDTKAKDLQDRQAAIKQYELQAQTTLQDQLQRMRSKVLVDIQATINDKAKAGGYTFVIDSSAQSITQTPFMLYHSSEVDITDAIIKQLNAGAPVDLTSPTNAVAP